MKYNGKNASLFFLFTVCLGTLFLACATKSAAYKDIDSAVGKNDFGEGLESIKKGQEKRPPLYPARNSVSLFLDKGLLEHYAGNYKDSSADLQNAERLIAEAYTKSVTADIASYIANDNTKEYPGEDFEDIYLNIFNALNYYNNGDIEGALVEIRKLTWTSGKLELLGRKYETVDARADEYMQTQLRKDGLSANPELPRSKSVNFSNSALARYLSVLFYQSEGNTDSARIEFARLQEAFSANPAIYYQPFPQSAENAGAVPSDGKTRLNIIGFTGLSPIKEEGVFDAAFPFFQNSILWWTRFKLPKMVKRPSRIDRIAVAVGGNTFNLELIEDMGAVVEETFNARFGSMFFKTFIRTLLKYAAVDIAASVTREQAGDTAATLAAIAGKATADASESADIRMSRYFPEKAYIGSINLEPGNYPIEVNFYSGKSIIVKETRNVTIQANRLNLIEFIGLK